MNGINLNYLSAFEAINNATGTEIVHFQDGVKGKELVSGGSYTGGRLIGRLIRWGDTKAKNNEIRQALLTALSRTFGLGRMENGVYRMPADVVSRLQGILGKGVLCAKSGNEFELNDKGEVCSGSPLTERRITQILNRVHELKAREMIVMNEDDYDPSILARGGKTLSEVISDTEAAKRQTLTDNFTVGKIDKDTDIWVEFDAVLKTSGAFVNTEERSQLMNSSLQDARNMMRTGLNDIPKNYDSFFRGMALHNELLQIANKDIGDPARRYRLLDPENFLRALSTRIDFGKHPERYPAEPIDLKQFAPSPVFEQFVMAGMLPDFGVTKNPLSGVVNQALDIARANGREQPDASDVFRGFVAAKMDKEVLQALANAIAKMFKPVYGTELLGSEKEKIQKAVKGALAAVGKDAAPSEAKLIDTLCTKFDALNLRGSMKLDVKHARAAMEMALDSLRLLLDKSNDVRTLMAFSGGGFTKSETFTFKADLGGKKDVELESSFTPALEKGNVNLGDKTKEVPPLSNLGVSTLKQKGAEKPIVSFVRFGQVSVVKALGTKSVSDKPFRESVRKAAFSDIARQMLAANPDLLKGKTNPDGSVDLPIYRVNMCGSNECMLRDVKSLDLDHEVDGQIYKVKVTVHDIFVPTDSPDVENEKNVAVLSFKHLAESVSELDVLLEEAEARKDQLGEAEKAKVGMLVKSLTDYRNGELKRLVDNKLNMRNAEGKRGPEMLRFGSQIALLASLLGHMPAINCNWGRDRTSAMDSEIKRLAVKLENGGVSDDDLKIQGSPSEEEKKERTEYLVKTGNTVMAKRMDCSTHPINLNQSKGTSGFSKMFADLDKAEESLLTA